MADVPQDNGQTTSTSGEFGASEFGARLDYTKPKYQDVWATVVFLVHVVILIVLCIVFWSSAETEEDEDTDWYSEYDDDSSDSFSSEDLEITGIIVALIASLAAGGLFGLLWLQCIRMMPEMIIKVMLGVQIAAWLVVAVVGVINNVIMLTVVALIIAAIFGLYTWCVWSRIAFAGVCLSIAAAITQKYSGIVWLSFASVFLAFIWYMIWGMTVWGYVLSVDGGMNNLVTFLFLVSLYWGAQICQNVSHTTTCGVAATWYFNSGELYSPSKKAFKRTMTSSFGSVCFGSLIVATLQAIKAMVKSQKRGVAVCIAICILSCIERLMRFFNKFAFAQVAIYGTNFVESGKRTWDLFMNRGISAIVNDDLSGLALICGAFFGFLVCAGTSVGVSLAFYDNIGLHILLGLVGGFLGYCVVVIILMVVASGVVAVFVCFAEDPAACAQNRPDEYARLIGANEQLNEMANGTNSVEDGAATGQTGAMQTGAPMQAQPAQGTQVVYVQQPPQGTQVVYVQQPMQQQQQQQGAPPSYGQAPAI